MGAMQLINHLYHGDCIDIMNTEMEPKSVDLIFADPPYNLQLENELWRPNQTLVDAVDDHWDQFNTFDDYDKFTYLWLKACKRVLKDTGTIWVIGSYHNIYRVGKIMHDLGYWTLNDILWVKTNPMPNFNGTRFQNAHETLIWAKKSKNQKKYTFNYHTMKTLNDDLQMRSDWHIPICIGEEREMINGKKAHSTQKPEALLRRVILSSSNVGDIIFDPFMGSGTTGAVAKKLKRKWIGIEKEKKYVEIALNRIHRQYQITLNDEFFVTPSKRKLPKVKFGQLLETEMIKEGEYLYSKSRKYKAMVSVDGTLVSDNLRGSIHRMGALVQGIKACNGWDFWYVERNERLFSIDDLRNDYRKKYMS